jgi:predicted PurR-regulated permease PerM
MNQASQKHFELASLLITATALALTLALHLLPALLAGLLVYQLVHLVSPRIASKRISGGRAKVLVVGLIASAVVVAITLLIWGVTVFLKGESGNLPALMQKMAEILGTSKMALPPGMRDWIPEVGVNGLQAQGVAWLKEHATEIRSMGGETVHTIVHILFGLIIGAMVALHEVTDTLRVGPLAQALTRRAALLSDSFRRVVFAQVKISAVNASLTGIYLLLALPLAGVHLPLAKTMVLLTFLFGLLPVLGNLLSNFIIVIISWSVSPALALASLAFLVVVHKLEYFMNAKIVGSQIRASAWEMLLAMLVMEAAFKIPGVIFAPILYAYIKRELVERNMV